MKSLNMQTVKKMPQDARVIYYDGDNGATTVESAMHEDGIVINPYSREPQLEPANVVVLYAF